MEETVIRQRPLSALLVGATGRHVLHVVTAFESRRIQTIRADDVADACERIPLDMPRVILSFVPTTDAEREALEDRALAVGALILHVDPSIDDASLKPLLAHAVHTALGQRARGEGADHASPEAPPSTQHAPRESFSEELDQGLLEEGWDD